MFEVYPKEIEFLCNGERKALYDTRRENIAAFSTTMASKYLDALTRLT